MFSHKIVEDFLSYKKSDISPCEQEGYFDLFSIVILGLNPIKKFIILINNSILIYKLVVL